jgi:hypothetical protein
MELDAAANRLERLELYRQADALRDQAQHLRLDARGLSGTESSEGKSGAFRPWEWNNAPQTAPTVAPTPTPTPSQPSTTTPTPAPATPDNPPKTPVPSLQPVPQPD